MPRHFSRRRKQVLFATNGAFICLLSVADLGEGPGGLGVSPYFAKKKKIAEGRKAGRAGKKKRPPPLHTP